jgi:hypothetical protein
VVADLDDLGGVDVVSDRELLRGNDPLGLVTDVHEDLVAVDLDDGPLEDVPLLEVLEALLDGAAQLVGREVVLLDRRLSCVLDLNQLLSPARLSAAGTPGRRDAAAKTGLAALGMVVPACSARQ